MMPLAAHLSLPKVQWITLPWPALSNFWENLCEVWTCLDFSLEGHQMLESHGSPAHPEISLSSLSSFG